MGRRIIAHGTVTKKIAVAVRYNYEKTALLQKRFVGTPHFFKDGPKFYPFLQMVLDYCSNRPAPKNVFVGAGHLPTCP